MHGWDIKILSPAYVFLKNSILTEEMFSESQLYLTQGEQIEAKSTWYIKFGKMSVFQKPNWVRKIRGPTIMIIKKQTLVFNHYVSGALRHISYTPNTCYGSSPLATNYN